MPPVGLHRMLRGVRRTRVDCVDHGVMLRHGRLDVAGEHADVHADVTLRLWLHAVMQRDEPRTGARFHNLAVQALVRLVKPPMIDARSAASAEEFSVQRLHLPGERTPFRDRQSGRPPRAQPFQLAHDVEKLVHVHARKWCDSKPCLLRTSGAHHETLLLETLQRFSNRRPAHTQPRRNLGFHHTAARREQTLHDQVTEALVHLLRTRAMRSIRRSLPRGRTRSAQSP